MNHVSQEVQLKALLPFAIASALALSLFSSLGHAGQATTTQGMASPTPDNTARAMRELETGVRAGDAKASCALANMLLQSADGKASNEVRARKLLEGARGRTPACDVQMAQMLMFGIGGPGDAASAGVLLSGALKAGELSAEWPSARWLLDFKPGGITLDEVREVLNRLSQYPVDTPQKHLLRARLLTAPVLMRSLADNRDSRRQITAEALRHFGEAGQDSELIAARQRFVDLAPGFATVEVLRRLDQFARMGHVPSQMELARRLSLGSEGLAPSIEGALHFYDAASRSGHVAATRKAGLLLIRSGDPAKGIQYLRAAANRKDPEAQVRMALLHAEGEALPRDFAQARLWMRKAVDATRGTRDEAFYREREGELEEGIQAYERALAAQASQNDAVNAFMAFVARAAERAASGFPSDGGSSVGSSRYDMFEETQRSSRRTMCAYGMGGSGSAAAWATGLNCP